VAGNAWSFDQTLDKLTVDVQRSGSIKVLMKSKDKMAFALITDVICPILQILNITGCYGCPYGAKIFFILRSRCDDGVVDLSYFSETGCHVMADWAMTMETGQSIEIVCPGKENDLQLTATGTQGGPSTITQAFILEEEVISGGNFINTDSSAEPNVPDSKAGGPDLSGFKFSNMFPKLGDLVGKLLSGLVWVIVGLIACCGTFVVGKALLSRSFKTKKP